MKKILIIILVTYLFVSVFSEDDRALKLVSKEKKEISRGKYYALIIGNNNYQYAPKLKTAKKDAEVIGEILKTEFIFDEVSVILDATRTEILKGIDQYRKKIKSDDYFLIYYAGHGEYLKENEKSYWLPVDAELESTSNWIIVDDITANLKLISSDHILVVSDSCYSGTMTRAAFTDLSSNDERSKYISKMMTKRSRTLMASGGNEPVADGGGNGHSVFAESFITGLKDMELGIFTAEELFYKKLKESVTGKADQTPEYSIIKNSGHDGGDFVFVKKGTNKEIVSQIKKQNNSILEVVSEEKKKVKIKVEKTYGTLKIEVASRGKILIDGQEMTRIESGKIVTLEDMETGKYKLELVYDEGNKEMKEILIENGKTNTVRFEWKKSSIPTNGLVGYWGFDNGDARDDSGNGNNGTIHGGVKFVDGVKGKAASFDGVNDYILVANNKSLNLVNMTLIAWVNPRRYTALPNQNKSVGDQGVVLCKGRYPSYNYRIGTDNIMAPFVKTYF